MHLEPFLDGKPLVIEKIKQAWPGLTLSDRVCLITVLLADGRNRLVDTCDENHALTWPHHREALMDLALADENGYVRYLAARHVSRPDRGDTGSAATRYNKVKADSSVLVESAECEARNWQLNSISPSYFWKYPQIKRLALINEAFDGEYVAGVLRYATNTLLPDESVTLYEMLDVLLQFLGPRFAEQFARGCPR